MDVHAKLQFGVVVLLLTMLPCDSRLTCLKCDSVGIPRTCHYVDRCGPHEACSTEVYVTSIGSLQYKLGCKDRQFCSSISTKRDAQPGKITLDKREGTLIRSSCCDGDLCNDGGPTNGFPETAGPVCYSCQSQIGADRCNQIEQCGRDRICELLPLSIPGAPPNIYITKCQRPEACISNISPGHLLDGKRGTACLGCCNGTLCNDGMDPSTVCADLVVTSTRTTHTVVAKTTATTAGASMAFTHFGIGGTSNWPSAVNTLHMSNTSSPSTVMSTQSTMKPSQSSTTSPQTKHTTTTPPHISGPGSSCIDVMIGCDASLHCTATDYAAWALIYCRKTCTSCSSTISTGPLSWTVMLKGSAGISAPDLYTLWASDHTINSHVEHAALLNTVFHGHYKSSLANNWTSSYIQKVKMAIYSGGMERAYIVFDATGITNKLDWFKPERILESSWGDLTKHSNASFHMARDSDTGWEFNVQKSHGGNPGDKCDSTGWMMVSTQRHCLHESTVRKPSFYYAPGISAVHWANSTPGAGEMFAILAHSVDPRAPWVGR